LHTHEPPFYLEGYRPASLFHYPAKLILFAKVPPLLLSLGLYFLAYRGVIGGGIFRGFIGVGVVIFILIAFFSVEIVHGLVQGGMNRLLGYETTLSIIFLAFMEATFVTVPGQYQSRRDALLIALTPLCLFLFLLIPVLLWIPGVVGSVLAFLLLVNLSGSAWDIYFLWWLWRKPAETVLYIEGAQLLLVYEPEAEQAKVYVRKNDSHQAPRDESGILGTGKLDRPMK
jgi:hypothetical protein